MTLTLTLELVPDLNSNPHPDLTNTLDFLGRPLRRPSRVSGGAGARGDSGGAGRGTAACVGVC